MRSSNPAFRNDIFARSGAQVVDRGPDGWAAPGGPTDSMQVTAASSGAMTLDGVVQKSGLLLLVLVAAAAFRWSAVELEVDSLGRTIATPPGWLILTAIAALGVAVVTIFKPTAARITAPLYAVLQGATVGAISAVYNSAYDGIVFQAVGLTVAIFVAMLVAYSSGAIRATEKFKRGVIMATMGIALYYLFAMVLSLFGGEPPLIWDSGPIGIGFSLVVVVIATLNLILDFDFVEKGVQSGAPKHLKWYAGFSLMVTIVWLYLELLRLLSKLRDN